MAPKVIINSAATKLHPRVMAQALAHPQVSANFPHAYCLKRIGMSGTMQVVDAYIGGPVCPHGFQRFGFVTDDMRQQMLGGVQVYKAGLGSFTLIVVGAGMVALPYVVVLPPVLAAGITILGMLILLYGISSVFPSALLGPNSNWAY